MTYPLSRLPAIYTWCQLPFLSSASDTVKPIGYGQTSDWKKGEIIILNTQYHPYILFWVFYGFKPSYSPTRISGSKFSYAFTWRLMSPIQGLPILVVNSQWWAISNWHASEHRPHLTCFCSNMNSVDPPGQFHTAKPNNKKGRCGRKPVACAECKRYDRHFFLILMPFSTTII